jgi:hypothetical protein
MPHLRVPGPAPVAQRDYFVLNRYHPLADRLRAWVDMRTGINLIEPVTGASLSTTKPQPAAPYGRNAHIARGFAGTYGTGTSDILTATVASKPVRVSYFLWTYRVSDGSSGFGRVWNSAGSLDALLTRHSTDGTYAYNREWPGTGNVDYFFPSVAANTWASIGISFDGSTAGNLPLVVVNGVQQTVTDPGAPVGSIGVTAGAYSFGNRASDLARDWDGMLGDWLRWDERLLTVQDFQALHENMWALQEPEPIAIYWVGSGAATLTIADCAHGHSVDNLTLTQLHSLVVADAAHAHAADNLALTQAHALVVAEAAHGHTADNLTLTQAHALAVADASHAHTVDNLTLTQLHSLAVADATHAHAADNLGLTVEGALAIADALHAHTSDNIVLTQLHVLAVADALHAHAAEQCNVSSETELAVADASHAHAADSLALTQAHMLSIAEAVHGHLADNLGLTQAHVLAILEALHAHTADNIALGGLSDIGVLTLTRSARGALTVTRRAGGLTLTHLP